MDAQWIIDQLGLRPHPEGGHYAETFRDERTVGGRSVGTAIYYLLQAGERSEPHRVDAAEVWHYYAGAALRLTIGEDVVLLGADLENAERPQAIVPADVWQAAESEGAWTLVGCTVAPGFEFSGLELAAEK